MEKLLIVDDDKFMHKIVRRKLGTVYDIFSAFTGEEGLSAAEQHLPDIILLDVEMPGINGYETCERLKSNSLISQIPVMFLSGKSSTRARMLGYEAGADDFITKPFESEEIDAKIKVCLQYVESREVLESQIKNVEKAATLAIADSSDFARLVHLTAEMFRVKTPEALSQKIFKYCNSLGLNTSLLINFNGSLNILSSSGTMTPLERELMSNMQGHKRFVDFGCRTVINYPGMSLLIKNMPLADPTLYGRFKDLLPHLVEIALACIKNMEFEQLFISQSANLSSTLEDVNVQMGGQLSQYQGRVENIETSLKGLMAELSKNIPSMGLDEDQEVYILDTISNTSFSISEQLDANSELGESLDGLRGSLQGIVNENRILVARLEVDDSLVENEVDDGDIELF